MTKQTTDAREIAEQLADLARHDVADLVHSESACEALVTIAGKAALARDALELLDEGRIELTIPRAQALSALLGEIQDGAWNVARITFAEDWQRRFGAER